MKKFTLTIHDIDHDEVQRILATTRSDEVTVAGANGLAACLPKSALEGGAQQLPADLAAFGAQQATGHTFASTEADVQARENRAADTASGDLDARGFPWNEKIHSGNQEKTAKGVWTKKRGASQELIDQVEAEMRASGWGQVGGAPAAPAQQAPQQSYAPPAQQPVAAPQEAQQPTFTPPAMGAYGAPVGGYPQQPVPHQPPAHVATQQPPTQQPYAPPAQQPAPQPAAVSQDYNGLMVRIGQHFQAGTITPDYLNTLTQRISQTFQVQVNAITDISNNPAMVAKAFELMHLDGKA